MKLRTQSVIVLPVALAVLFCFGLELASLYQADQKAPGSTAQNTPQPTQNKKTTTLPQLEVAPQTPLRPITTTESVPTTAATETVAPAAPTNGVATLQPSATPNGAGESKTTANAQSQAQQKAASPSALQKIVTQRLNITLPSKK